jgi:hypothetical protein
MTVHVQPDVVATERRIPFERVAPTFIAEP